MDNTDNINPTSENTKAKLLKLCFPGASGNNPTKLDNFLYPQKGKITYPLNR